MAGMVQHAVLATMALVVQLFMLVQCSLNYVVVLLKPRLSADIRREWRQLAGPEELDTHPVAAGGRLSVIIPCLNEEATIIPTLELLIERTSRLDLIAEIVVADSGSTDNTASVVKHFAQKRVPVLTSAPLKIIVAPPTGDRGRGPALNAGIALATGELVLFLHADAVAPAGYDDSIRSGLGEPRVLAAAFRFQCNRDSIEKPPGPPGLAVMEATVALRSTCLQLPFGDQGLAITRSRMQAMGGFDQVPIMEDFEFVVRLRKAGAAGRGRIKVFDAAMECSARRWEKYSVWKTNLLNQQVMIRYTWLGATTNDIYESYYGKKA